MWQKVWILACLCTVKCNTQCHLTSCHIRRTHPMWPTDSWDVLFWGVRDMTLLLFFRIDARLVNRNEVCHDVWKSDDACQYAASVWDYIENNGCWRGLCAVVSGLCFHMPLWGCTKMIGDNAPWVIKISRGSCRALTNHVSVSGHYFFHHDQLAANRINMSVLSDVDLYPRTRVIALGMALLF